MELAFAFFALNAETAPNHHLHVFGGDFEAVVVPEIPALFPPFSLVVKFRLSPDEVSRPHRFSLQLEEPNGQRLWMSKDTEFHASPNWVEPEAMAGATLIVQIGIRFKQLGKHLFHIFGDDHEYAVLPIYVKTQPESGKASNR